MNNQQMKHHQALFSEWLDMVHCVNGVICLLPGKQLPPSQLSFDRRAMSEFHDAMIISEESLALSCHRCLLSSRLDYFHALFSTAWIETSVNEGEMTTLKLPIAGEVLEILLDYLYTDNPTRIIECDNIELLCNVMVVSDQLLITRLKEICEIAIAHQLNLRNVCEVLQLTVMCCADQLKATCLQFIVINLSALLELRSLDRLSDQLMDEITSCYRETIPGMSRRVITPYSGYPDFNTLEELEGNPNPAAASVHRRAKTQKKRAQSSAVTEDSLETTEKLSEESPLLTKFSLEAEKLTLSKTIPHVHTEFSFEEQTILPNITDFKIDKQLESISPNNISPRSSSRRSSTPRWADLVTSPLAKPAVVLDKTPPAIKQQPAGPGPGLRDIFAEQITPSAEVCLLRPTKSNNSKKKKLSQNDRKKLAALSFTKDSDLFEAKNAESSSLSLEEIDSVAPANPWGTSVNTLVKSLKDVMLSEKTAELRSQTVQSKKSRPTLNSEAIIREAKPSGRRPQVAVVGSTIDAQVGAWKTSSSPVHSLTTNSSSSSFVNIVQDELQQHEALHNTTKKPLALIMMEEQEEQAFNQLLKTYHQADGNPCEFATVQRVSVNSMCARPLWVTSPSIKH